MNWAYIIIVGGCLLGAFIYMVFSWHRFDKDEEKSKKAVKGLYDLNTWMIKYEEQLRQEKEANDKEKKEEQ